MRLTSGRRSTALALLLLTVLCIEWVAAGRDFYKILGVSRNASKRDIKRAHRKLSAKYHPDKNKDEDAHEKFVEVNEAYKVLSDDDLRKTYDRHGEDAIKDGRGKNQQQGGMFDLFNMFGFGGGGGGNGQQQERKGPTIEVELEVSLADLYLGRELEAQINKQILCRTCGGTGAASPNDVQTCPVCGGSGIVMKRHQLGPGIVQQVQATCDRCGGKGQSIKRKCPVCGGAKVQNGENELYISIERGMPDGHRIVFEREGDQDPNSTPGDVVFIVKTAPHPTYTRKGHDLHTTAKITLLEALVGFTKNLRHVDGHTVEITRTDITVPGHVEKIVEEGMPHHEWPTEAGDMYVKFEIVMPESLTDEQKEGIKKILG